MANQNNEATNEGTLNEEKPYFKILGLFIKEVEKIFKSSGEIIKKIGVIIADTMISSIKESYILIVRIFRQDPVETLYSAIPSAHSEINFLTITRFFLFFLSVKRAQSFIRIIKNDLWFDLPEEVLEFQGKKLCPAFGNSDICEMFYRFGCENLGILFFQTIMHYFSCVQGAKLKRRTFFKINVIQTVVSMMQVVSWMDIYLNIWWIEHDTGAWFTAESESDPEIQILMDVLLLVIFSFILAFMNYRDSIKKYREHREWGSDLE